MIAPEAAVDTTANASNGVANPSPKVMKRSRLAPKASPETERVKKTAINKGLQGMTMAPKKKP